MSKQLFKSFINNQASEMTINNYDGKLLSWNNCAIGRFIKEVKGYDPIENEDKFKFCRLELLSLLPNLVAMKLSSGVYKTYGELQLEL